MFARATGFFVSDKKVKMSFLSRSDSGIQGEGGRVQNRERGQSPERRGGDAGVQSPDSLNGNNF